MFAVDEGAVSLAALRDQRQVQCWTLCISAVAARQADYGRQLSEQERERAKRLHFAPDRARFVCTRAVLRGLLGQYLSLPPEEIVFSYGPQGKPALLEDELQFSVAHSGDYALLVFCAGAEVGVDIERQRPMVTALRWRSAIFPGKSAPI